MRDPRGVLGKNGPPGEAGPHGIPGPLGPQCAGVRGPLPPKENSMFAAIKRLFHDQSAEIRNLQSEKEALHKRVATLEEGNAQYADQCKTLSQSNAAYKSANTRLSNMVERWKGEYHKLYEELHLEPDEHFEDALDAFDSEASEAAQVC